MGHLFWKDVIYSFIKFCKHILHSLWTYDKIEVVGRAYYILV